ncbi:MAG: pyrroline-5-carboxylate reductase, partial [Planctomycetes bacterium]|nr:pyrroline-5-carboxylate reductase [Planctomycetota bacterium]
ELWGDKLLGIVGGGNMAEALVRGVLAAGLLPARQVVVFDPLPDRREVFAGLGCLPVVQAQDVVAAEVILLAVKPQTMREAVMALDLDSERRRLILSIAAGIATARIETLLPPGTPVVRIMPNTPLLVGMGVSALARGTHATAGDLELAAALFACGGQAVVVDEALLDAVTALSGSGPAYLFRFAEALMAGAVDIGLPPDLARDLTIGTLRGAAEMLVADPDAAALRQRVTSPGGTTAAALVVFDRRDLTGMVAEALRAARDRSLELGR